MSERTYKLTQETGQLQYKDKPDVLQKQRLSDGRAVWIQRIKVPGVRKPHWSVVVCAIAMLEAPTLYNVPSLDEALSKLGDILQADVTETDE